MPNPLVSQGSLNLLKASLTVPSFPVLNVTSSYLAREGIRLTLQGQAVAYLEAMTGAVTSPNPYLMCECVVNILKSQALSSQYKAQMELNALIGDITIRSDSTVLSPYQMVNCSIQAVRELDFSGQHAIYPVVIGGYYLINSSLFD